MMTAAGAHHAVRRRTVLAACGVIASIAAWTAVMRATNLSYAMQVEVSEYGRNLTACLFMIAGGARLVCWRLASDWAAARVGLLLLALGTALPAGSILNYAVDTGPVARIEAPEARLVYFAPLVLLALLVSTGNRRRFTAACLLICGSGIAIGAAVELLGSPAANEPYTGLWILVEAAATAGWIGLAFHAWARRSATGDRGVFCWAFAAMLLLASSEIVKIASLTGATALHGLSAGIQLTAAAIVTANAVHLLVVQVRQRALDDSVGRMLLSRRDRIDEMEHAQRQRLHDARSAVLGVRGASTLLTSGRSTADTDVLRSLLSAELDRLHALLDADESAATELFDVADAVGPTIATHRLAGTRIHDSLPHVVAFGRPLVLATVVDNLLRNAEQHAPGANVAVRVRVVEAGAEIVVEDDGPGIPAEERDQVLLPGIRGTTARGIGSGLGLSGAARAIAELNGTLRIEGCRHGGTRVVATLPGGTPIATGPRLLMAG